MPLKYQYVVEGLGADQETWKHEGELDLNAPGDFMLMPNTALRDSFMALTQGRAQFGNPGKGCRGPYEVTRLEIKVKE